MASGAGVLPLMPVPGSSPSLRVQLDFHHPRTSSIIVGAGCWRMLEDVHAGSKLRIRGGWTKLAIALWSTHPSSLEPATTVPRNPIRVFPSAHTSRLKSFPAFSISAVDTHRLTAKSHCPKIRKRP
ncbi:uncharacterized protein CANTADRAFT_26219 [Suhomyces tanzawaensis NRRL Y-17324]|uniref:Uncharacterized protein n=1 Tax=Suhomyces tanzawaensis NRRL Y-17324 TaxID=984487 RepID=A0A1E4SI76_9ASCO|nr:uncharacterized protein CANTADRAFT_26219 [Suhomyces tanzawaensis NRRL Y-17324]ODV79218.1 hypothetical protein CANTADRAFT_26219 [Suhomyces tanzawaensis NRRL Y-17324]